MTNYWLSVTTRENFDGGHDDIDVYLPNCQKRVESVQIGDKFISYIMKECAFGDIYEATYKDGLDDLPDFDRLAGLIRPDEKREGKKKYTLLFYIKPILVPISNKILLDARALFRDFPYIQNPNSWGWYVRHSLRSISEDEFKLIESKMKKSGLYKEVHP
jgi:hypothetical protein